MFPGLSTRASILLSVLAASFPVNRSFFAPDQGPPALHLRWRNCRAHTGKDSENISDGNGTLEIHVPHGTRRTSVLRLLCRHPGLLPRRRCRKPHVSLAPRLLRLRCPRSTGSVEGRKTRTLSNSRSTIQPPVKSFAPQISSRRGNIRQNSLSPVRNGWTATPAASANGPVSHF